MTTLERVMQLQSQGLGDSDIITQLKNEGISAKEINDSLGQARIKAAVSQQEIPEQESMSGMEQSIMQDTQDLSQPQEMQPELQPQEQEQYQQAYSQNQEYPEQYQQFSTETITEIAEQVVSEKFSEYKSKTGDIISFKNDVEEKIKDLNERVRRIESSLENIQRAIIGKIGEFGENSAYIRKDLENLHNTVAKLMNPLIDNYRNTKKPEKPSSQKEQF